MTSKLIIVLLLLLAAPRAFAQGKPAIPEMDRVRLAEAFHISETLGDRVWPGWDRVPFAVLLVTADNEFLVRHPHPSPDFTLIGYDPLLKSNVYVRKRTLPLTFLATFPAVGGISTVVVGEAQNTWVKTSTPWVITLLHEHFHQLQDSQPGSYEAVNALNLAHADQTGMWMLNYAFPYKDPQINARFSDMSRLLAAALQARRQPDFPARLKAYLQAQRAFQRMLAPDDAKYFAFQIWKEGIARYTEWRMADLAARGYRPSKAFRALNDYTPFSDVARSLLHTQILAKLPTLQLETSKRLVFYPIGAAEGMLLDRANPRWQHRYFAEKFAVDKYFSPSKQLPRTRNKTTQSPEKQGQ